MKKFFGLLALLVLPTIGLAALGWWSRPQPVSAQPPPTPTPEVIEVEASPSARPNQQLVQDSAGLYTLELPEDWQVSSENPDSPKLSGLAAQSPDYSVKIGTAPQGEVIPINYEAGALLQVQVWKQALSTFPVPSDITAEKPVILSGVNGSYYVRQEKGLDPGQTLEVRFEKQNRTFILRFVYNPEKFPQGPAVFDQILQSLIML